MIVINRLFFLLLIFLIVFLAILSRLFYWQVIKGGELAVVASKQYNLLYEVKSKRGKIFFQDNTPFVLNQPGFLLVGNPHEIEDTKNLAKILSPILSEEEASIAAKIKEELYWVPIKHRVDIETKTKIEALNIKGITFEEEPLRFYPEGSMSAQLLGFVGSDINGLDKGYFGLEGFYDREINGKGGVAKRLIDGLGRPILLGDTYRSPVVDGRDLVLHIDRTIQFIAEKSLVTGIQKYGAKGGSVIIMDPKDGSILAMVSTPSYDPAAYQEYDDSLYKNPAVAATYEPGSTFKVLVMASAINENLITPETKCDACDGPVSIGGFSIRTWNNKYYKDSTMADVLIHSDNTGMVFVSKKLGLDKYYSYITQFGIGSPTEIDLEDEESPSLRPKEQWRQIDLATGSFGQGIAVSPIQMVKAVAAIANGGKVFKPHVVAKVIKENGDAIEIKPELEKQVISEKTAKIVTEMMVNAVDKGEAKFAKPIGYRIAGKTGTAQIPIAGHYDPNKTIASFIGFAPADDPKFIMLVKVDEPSSSIFGAETAAPLFFDIAKQLFTYYGIPPSQ